MNPPVDYASPIPVRPTTFRRLAAALLTAIAGSALAVVLTVRELWWIPRGTSIRPLGLVGLLFLVALATFGCVTTLVVLGLIQARRDWRAWLLGVVALAVSITPLPDARATYDWIEARHGLVSEP